MIFYEQPTDKWTPYDFKLLEAYQILQDEICPQCGHPVWLCRSDSNRIAFKVNSTVCYAERALQKKRDDAKDKKHRADAKERAEYGKIYYTEPFVPKNVEGGLPTRSEYYDQLVK